MASLSLARSVIPIINHRIIQQEIRALWCGFISKRAFGLLVGSRYRSKQHHDIMLSRNERPAAQGCSGGLTSRMYALVLHAGQRMEALTIKFLI